jgi:Zn-dependent metalloprotease
VNYIDNDNNWTASEWNNANKDNAALDAHWGAMMTYDYLKNKFNRNSYDNQNSPIIAYANAKYMTENAGWYFEEEYVEYGSGSSSWQPVTSLDVVAHEITHGVTYSITSLIYSGESGALNESISDIIAACVENSVKPNSTNNWIIAEEILSGGLRNMSNPKSKGHPDTYLKTNWSINNNRLLRKIVFLFYVL